MITITDEQIFAFAIMIVFIFRLLAWAAHDALKSYYTNRRIDMLYKVPYALSNTCTVVFIVLLIVVILL